MDGVKLCLQWFIDAKGCRLRSQLERGLGILANGGL